MNVAILKYNAGNVQSVTYALERLGVSPILTDNPEKLQQADKVIFPGVGEASTTMQYLKRHQLDQVIRELKQPFLGICLGMQLMCQHSEEGDVDCLGVFSEPVKRFPNQGLKVPHMGWNKLLDYSSPLFETLPQDPYVYFVHSYYVAVGPDTIASSDYGLPFSAALHKENYYATQFHPEKSGDVGSKILEQFLKIDR